VVKMACFASNKPFHFSCVVTDVKNSILHSDQDIAFALSAVALCNIIYVISVLIW